MNYNEIMESIINFKITPKLIMWMAFIIMMVSIFSALLCKVEPKKDTWVKAEATESLYIEGTVEYQHAPLEGDGMLHLNPWYFI